LKFKQNLNAKKGREMMNKAYANGIVFLLALLSVLLWVGNGFAIEKLVVEDGSANQVFSVSDDGTTRFSGADANNAFSYKIIGHAGGSSHTQTVTDLADSRLTVMAAEAADYAPRLQMTGPQDVATAVQGWMIFDYGSGIYSLPDARFVLRHFDGTGKDGFAYIMQTVGRQSVSFPISNVGIGTTTPTHLIHLGGGAYSDGATWVNASSRELKKDIREVSAAEAIETVEKLKPVSFVYKEGNQDMHVGFIAEDVPEMVATGDRKGLESMDVAAVLTKVVQEQQRMLKEQQKAIRQLQDKIVGLENSLQLKKDKDLNVAQFSDGTPPSNN
jgi:hypothetical protein